MSSSFLLEVRPHIGLANITPFLGIMTVFSRRLKGRCGYSSHFVGSRGIQRLNSVMREISHRRNCPMSVNGNHKFTNRIFKNSSHM